MQELFVDTSAWLALELRRDQYHNAAFTFARTQARKYQLVTTNWVLSETITLLRRRTTHTVAVRFMERIRTSKELMIIRITFSYEERAWQIFKKYTDKDFGFVDCTSFAVMEMSGISTAFTFDHHFRQMGFIALPSISITR
jgi:predicted nucleic acid-binding protein